MLDRFTNRFWGRFFLLIGFFFALIFSGSYFFYTKGLSETIQEAIDESIAQADAVNNKTQLELEHLAKLGTLLRDEKILSKSLQEQQSRIRQIMAENNDVYSLALIYDEKTAKDRSDVFLTRSDPARLLLKEDSLQWATQRAWYEKYKEGQKIWSDSAFVSGKRKIPKIQISTLVGDKDAPEGVIVLHLLIADLEQILNTAKLGNAGYSFIVSKSGHFIYHPVDDWVLSGRTINDPKFPTYNREVRQSVESARNGENKLLEISNPVNGLDTWYFFEPIQGTDWVLGVTFFKEEMVNNIFNRRQHQILLSILLIMMLGNILLGVSFLMNTQKSTYGAVVIISFILLCGIIYVISISFKNPILKPYDLEPDDVKVTELPVLEHYLDVQDSIFNKFDDQPPTYIKTGIFVEHAALREAHMVMVSGYLWQEYELGKHDDVRRGFIFPETDPHPEYLDVREAYREIRDGKEVVGWYFRVALRKKFNYEHFPFDWQNIRIKIWHPDFLKNVICIPDLSGYPILNPTSLPGIKEKFEFPNWTVKQSFFSFKNGKYNADFGLRQTSSRKQIPELCFNIYIKRIYISPMVSNMFTIGIIIVLLFVAQVIESNKGKNPSKGILLGSLGLIELAAAFSFVLIIAHTSLRDNLSVEELIYVDYYYFTTYFMILLTCVNFIIVNKKLEEGNESFVNRKDWLKVHFWPIVFGLFYLVTVIVFY